MSMHPLLSAPFIAAVFWWRAGRMSLVAFMLVLVTSAIHAQTTAETRIALVIGNSAYLNAPELTNPKNDSTDIAAALDAIGFEVQLHMDQSQGQLFDTLRKFQRDATGADIALIYYAGHGIEIDRQNYLIPVDAVLEADTDVTFEAVPLETVMFAAGGARRLSMVIVDACRNNPFAVSMTRRDASRSIGRGLAAVEPSRNTLVAYAAKEGMTAADGAGRNSPYATALIDALRQSNLEVGLMMRQVRDDVLDATAGQQEPFVYGSLSAEQIYLNGSRGLQIIDPEIAAGEKPDTSAAEIAFWKSITHSSEAVELENYLAIYPNGLFADLAHVRIARLEPTVPRSDEPTRLSVESQRQQSQPEIDRNLTRNEIVELQESLSVLGHILGAADGISGRRTEAAIREFEDAENLPITASATLTVLEALRERVDDNDLALWRTEQAARRRIAPQQLPQSTKPAQQESDTAVSTEQSPRDTQFCRINRRCDTSECLIGSSGKFFRKLRRCAPCQIYAQRCR
jgi:peptidoglycan hydrolase-like protein with peptidoglycan-binding domain